MPGSSPRSAGSRVSCLYRARRGLPKLRFECDDGPQDSKEMGKFGYVQVRLNLPRDVDVKRLGLTGNRGVVEVPTLFGEGGQYFVSIT